MTDDQWDAVRWTRQFLEKLAHSQPTIVDPRLRDEAHHLLCRFPDLPAIKSYHRVERMLLCRTD